MTPEESAKYKAELENYRSTVETVGRESMELASKIMGPLSDFLEQYSTGKRKIADMEEAKTLSGISCQLAKWGSESWAAALGIAEILDNAETMNAMGLGEYLHDN